MAAPLTFDRYRHLASGLPMFGGYGAKEELVAAWKAHAKTILSAWVAALPGTRPFGWWLSEGRERRLLTPAEVREWAARYPDTWGRCVRADTPRRAIIREAWTRETFGLLHVHTLPPAQESERCYLDRHGLLSDAERAAPVAADEGRMLASRCLYHELYGGEDHE